MNSISFWLFLFSPRCQCPAQFEGPECQQNKHSFHGNGYAWFPPIILCFESHVSLEFITDVADGLLLYSGPLAQLQAWDHEDFIALGRNFLNSMSQNTLTLHLIDSFLFAASVYYFKWSSQRKSLSIYLSRIFPDYNEFASALLTL